MEVVHSHCAGLDVHRKTVVATIIMPDDCGGLLKETRTFETLTSDLLAMSDWLMSLGITHVAVAGNYAYVADQYDGLRIINMSLPSPVEVGFYSTPGYPI